MSPFPAFAPTIYAVTFDGTISLGNIITALAIIVSITSAFVSLRGRLEAFQKLMERQETRLDRSDERIDRTEAVTQTLAQSLQKLVGMEEGRSRAEQRYNGSERRSRGSRGEA